ncbi:aldehyde oxidase GLOX1-like [Magnolia sinica]|uniref:aldehyde oxidase GLOX1-like n=1 Tax=Magnolia sinica TaxID=86752 RepID=UPI002657E0AD|nr:aldehyde oxidase GLOX1-like [Magnolia sinica]
MKSSILFSLFLVVSFFSRSYSSESSNKGVWKVVKKNLGISAMHMALLPNDMIIAFDRTDFGPSNITLPHGKCRHDSHDQALTTDCYAHSIEFDPNNRNVRPLTVQTDTWCSSGALAPDGTLIQSGGFNDGDRSIRTFSPCKDCDWFEIQNGLTVRRWYASNQILPSGKIIVVGGRDQFNYEFIPKTSKSDQSVFKLPFLRETRGLSAENNLYPFLHLSPDGNLFIFANDRAILLDYINHKVVREFEPIPGGYSRNYPSAGSSVLLPVLLSDKNVKAEVLICGGALPDSNYNANRGIFMPASNTCGRLKITDVSPKWEMEEMPMRRVMSDMIILPTGDVLIINGAEKGTSGWGVARDPVLTPVLYRTELSENVARGFETLNPSKIPRLYHSTAHLLPDGRVLVGGSNPNSGYSFTNVLYPTELSLETFSPPYLSPTIRRPKITFVKPGTNLTYKQRFSIEFESKKGDTNGIYVTMVAPSFTTHSNSMNQRLLVLAVDRIHQDSRSYAIDGLAPATPNLAPPGHYLLFVVHDGVPSRGKWVHIK